LDFRELRRYGLLGMNWLLADPEPCCHQNANVRQSAAHGSNYRSVLRTKSLSVDVNRRFHQQLAAPRLAGVVGEIAMLRQLAVLTVFPQFRDCYKAPVNHF
jgi:hypothetical protein